MLEGPLKRELPVLTADVRGAQRAIELARVLPVVTLLLRHSLKQRADGGQIAATICAHFGQVLCEPCQPLLDWRKLGADQLELVSRLLRSERLRSRQLPRLTLFQHCADVSECVLLLLDQISTQLHDGLADGGFEYLLRGGALLSGVLTCQTKVASYVCSCRDDDHAREEQREREHRAPRAGRRGLKGFE